MPWLLLASDDSSRSPRPTQVGDMGTLASNTRYKLDTHWQTRQEPLRRVCLLCTISRICSAPVYDGSLFKLWHFERTLRALSIFTREY